MSSVCFFARFNVSARIFARFSESRKTPWGRDLFMKFYSILVRILTLAFIMLVGILTQPTLLLFLRLFITLVISKVNVWVKFSDSDI